MWGLPARCEVSAAVAGFLHGNVVSAEVCLSAATIFPTRQLRVLTLKLRRCVGVCQRQCYCPQVHFPVAEPVGQPMVGALASNRHGTSPSEKEFVVPCLSPAPFMSVSLGAKR